MSNHQEQSNSFDKIDRRKFIEVAAVTAGVMFIKPGLVRGTAANSAVRVGLLGCGGRGTEDATNLVDTGGARVVALADLFRDQLDTARTHFDKIQHEKGYAAIDASELFTGPNAYQQIAASKEVDAIVVQHWHYYGASAPTRLAFDAFDEFKAYLQSRVKPGDAIDVWPFPTNIAAAIARGKYPDGDGRVPIGGAY